MDPIGVCYRILPSGDKNRQLTCVLDTMFEKVQIFEQKYYRKLVDFICILEIYPITKTSYFV